MKNIGMLLLLSFIFLSSTCKNGPKPTPDPHDHDKPSNLLHKHCYKYYKMKFTDIQRSPNSLTGRLKSEGVEYAFIIGSDLDSQIIANQNNPNFEYSVYKFVRGNNYYQNCETFFPNNLSILVSINPTLNNNTINEVCVKENLALRGDFGCIPKLLYTENAILHLNSSDNQFKFLPLPTVIHKELGDKHDIAEFLKCYCFKISNTDFNSLDSTTRGNPNYELGIDTFKVGDKVVKSLVVFSSEGNRIFTCNEMN
ncbi:MAG: hypothetical protein IPM26_13885 [Saprospiraceae bacterium]|nr:hypothetical protein [Saprospiraceae bacterium]